VASFPNLDLLFWAIIVPNYLTDLTYNRILDNLSAGQSVSSTLLEFGCSKAKCFRLPLISILATHLLSRLYQLTPVNPDNG
jgi:hypothetical protein